MSDRHANRPRYRGTNAQAVRSRALLERTVREGEFGRLLPAHRQAYREAIAAGTCPWCGAGPFRVLALHVHHRHGIDRRELRRLAGYPREVSICDPAVTANAREAKLRTGHRPPPGARVQRPPCAVCGGPVPGKAGRKVCSKECDTARRREATRRQRAQAPRLQRWSRKHDSCIECKSDQLPHVCRGRCARCYERNRSRDRRTNRAATGPSEPPPSAPVDTSR